MGFGLAGNIAEGKNIFLTKEEKLNLLVGITDKNKKINLEEYFPNLFSDDDFMQKIEAIAPLPKDISIYKREPNSVLTKNNRPQKYHTRVRY